MWLLLLQPSLKQVCGLSCPGYVAHTFLLKCVFPLLPSYLIIMQMTPTVGPKIWHFRIELFCLHMQFQTFSSLLSLLKIQWKLYSVQSYFSNGEFSWDICGLTLSDVATKNKTYQQIDDTFIITLLSHNVCGNVFQNTNYNFHHFQIALQFIYY